MCLPKIQLRKCIAFVIIICLTVPFKSHAQTRKKLENKRTHLIEQIVYTSKLIKENKIKKASTISDLNTIERQIKQRNQLIAVIDKKNNSLNSRFKIIADSIALLEYELDSTKSQYHILLRKAYIYQKTTHPYQFFLSSKNIYEGFKNMIYMRQLDNFIQIKYQHINNLKVELATQKQTLELAKEDLQFSMKEQIEQKSKMSNDLSHQAKILSKLKKDASTLKSKLNKQKRDRERLNTEIENIILSQLRSVKKESSPIPLSPEAKLRSSIFVKNKGQLPWPTKKGIIISSYGKHRHKTLNQVTINNNGIDIQTQSGGEVMAIFEGEIVGIAHIPGYDKMVVIKHGLYYSVYSKLIGVCVTKGQKIKTGDKLGNVNSSGDNKGIVHLEVWKGKNKLNPAKWILKR